VKYDIKTDFQENMLEDLEWIIIFQGGFSTELL
jgi:hypothetical protein